MIGRVSTSQLYLHFQQAHQKGMGVILETQQQIASGQRIRWASEDPVAMAGAMQWDRVIQDQTRLLKTSEQQQSVLSLEEAGLGEAVELVRNAYQRFLEWRSPTGGSSATSLIRQELRQIEEGVRAIANTTAPGGGYLWSGGESSIPPFDAAWGYQGTALDRRLDLPNSATVSLTPPGNWVWESLPLGSGAALRMPSPSNQGTLIPEVSGSALTVEAGQWEFGVGQAVSWRDAAGAVTWSGTWTPTGQDGGVVDRGSGTPLRFSGNPAPGDIWEEKPTGRGTLGDLMEMAEGALRVSGEGEAANTQREALSRQVIDGLQQAMEWLTQQRSAVGIKMQQWDQWSAAARQKEETARQAKSSLVDTDIAKAATVLSQEQTRLEALYLAFRIQSNLRLTNYL